MTLTSHADIMYSSGGVYLLLASLLLCQPVHMLEILGYSLYAIGVYMLFTDPFATKTGMEGQSILGDVYAFAGAGFAAIFSYINSTLANEIHPVINLTHCLVF